MAKHLHRMFLTNKLKIMITVNEAQSEQKFRETSSFELQQYPTPSLDYAEGRGQHT